ERGSQGQTGWRASRQRYRRRSQEAELVFHIAIVNARRPTGTGTFSALTLICPRGCARLWLAWWFLSSFLLCFRRIESHVDYVSVDVGQRLRQRERDFRINVHEESGTCAPFQDTRAAENSKKSGLGFPPL